MSIKKKILLIATVFILILGGYIGLKVYFLQQAYQKSCVKNKNYTLSLSLQVDNSTFFVPICIGEKFFKMHIDTEANTSMLDREFLEENGEFITKFGFPKSADGIEIDNSLYTMSFNLGGINFLNNIFLKYPTKNILKCQDNEWKGLLGVSSLRHCIWGFEIDNNKLTISDNLNAYQLKEYKQFKGFPSKKHGANLNRITYDVNTLGMNLPLVYDMGYNYDIFLTNKTIKQLNLDENKSIEKEVWYGYIYQTVAGNNIDTVTFYKNANISLFGVNFDSVLIENSKKYVGDEDLLGTNLMMNFNFILDYLNKVQS